MKRREFLAGSLAMGVALATARPAWTEGSENKSSGKFKLKYAPHFGMFEETAGEDHVDQLKFIADQGFRALEDNFLKNKPVAQQERIAREMTRLGLEMGVFIATHDFENVTFASGEPKHTEKALRDMRESVEVAKRVNAKWCTMVIGCYDVGMEWDYQTANVIELLKRCAEICEPSGLTMVLEPLNAWTNHPGLFLTKAPQAYMICKSVDSPSCKILFDIYHQQITEGNIIPNLDKTWSEIGYLQTGDNPGRNEPTTGEINYKNIFRHLHKKECDMIIGMEHGNSKDGKKGERAVIDAYRACDDFDV